MGVHYFFIGIGGSGMSRLALFLHREGIAVSGSDRAFCTDTDHPVICRLQDAGIPVFADDGSGIGSHISTVVISAAVEADNPELIRVVQYGVLVVKRSELLADIFNSYMGWGVAGTSGKTTTTGMLTSVCRANSVPHRFYAGDDLCAESMMNTPIADHIDSIPMVCEIDESDGSPVLYNPYRLIVTNISEDHKQMDQLRDIFKAVCMNTRNEIILNIDCEESRILGTKLDNKKILTFGINHSADFNAVDISPTAYGTDFSCNGVRYMLRVPGIHNVYNALAVIGLCVSSGLLEEDIARGLYTFRGMKRRLELIAEDKNGVRVYDDYSHNPDKILAALSTLKHPARRVHWVFRPHGYGPMLLFRNELRRIVSDILSPMDRIYILDIYDAGGTANRIIHATDLVNDFTQSGLDAVYIANPDTLAGTIKEYVQPKDTVVIMGARDPYLRKYAMQVATVLIDMKVFV